MSAVGEGIGAAADYTGELFVLGGIILTGILGWIGTIVQKRFREPTRIETLWGRIDAQDVKINGLETRVDTAERVAGASGRVIRDLGRQWPGDHTPRLNPADLDILDSVDENTIPPHWKVKP